MFTPAQPFLTHAEAAEEVVAIAAPVVVPFKFRAGFAEEFKLHLLKFPCAENEVARSDSLRKDLPICAIPNGIFLRIVR